jgi:DNA-binding NtrC family response regulator
MAAEAVAIINSSPDTIELLRRVLQHAGFLVVSGYTFDIRDGRLDITAFVEQHRPKVIVYDIAPPYEENWRLFNHVRELDGMRQLRFVITSVNASHVEGLVGRDEHVYEVVERPLDLDRIVTAVKEAVRARPTR